MSLAHHYVKGRAEAGQRPSNATAERARKDNALGAGCAGRFIAPMKTTTAPALQDSEQP